tara:strand:- start:13156 stop:13776 length:621 start_codon:yes stop_codon:yes gene_type:complete
MKKSIFIGSAIVSATVLTAVTFAALPDKNTAVPIPVIPYPEPQAPPPPIENYICDGCEPNENLTLSFLQVRGITDKAALATVMGNIKQESKFIPNICEGGARVPYEQCLTGGYGIIQWTTQKRYDGLSTFCTKYECNPSTIQGQLRYMVNEPQWLDYEVHLKTEDQPIAFYMNHAYNWLGWGIHGKRTKYSHEYYSQLTKPSGNVA